MDSNQQLNSTVETSPLRATEGERTVMAKPPRKSTFEAPPEREQKNPVF